MILLSIKFSLTGLNTTSSNQCEMCMISGQTHNMTMSLKVYNQNNYYFRMLCYYYPMLVVIRFRYEKIPVTMSSEYSSSSIKQLSTISPSMQQKSFLNFILFLSFLSVSICILLSTVLYEIQTVVSKTLN